MEERKKSDKIIEIIGVSKVYDGVTVVDDMNLSIKRGEFVTLLGPSGCGKTTLLRMLAGFTQPTEGKILLEGVDVTNIPPYRRQINTVFQKYALFPHLNVFNNVAFGLKLLKIPYEKERDGVAIQLFRKYTKQEIKEKVIKALSIVGLEDYGHRDVNSLSGGQQQRVAIARALVLEPKVLLLDEPLGALDLKMRKDMQQELKKMHRELGITFVYVTHDQEEALTMSDNIAVIKDGSLQQYNNPKKIYDEPANAFVADFIGESNILSGFMKADFLVEFLGAQLKCMDKGYAKNEKVDLVVRPEDITLSDAGKGAPKENQIEGAVLSSVFKGTYYQIEADCNGYEFTVQSPVEFKHGTKVYLGIEPNSIHIMKRMRAINEFIGTIIDEETVEICGGNFAFRNDGTYQKGDTVKARIAFDKVELTDDEDDGIIGANVTQSLYKGKYYQVQVFTDDDMDFYVDTPYEWDTDDRVGIKVNPEDISLEHYEEEDEEDADEKDKKQAD